MYCRNRSHNRRDEPKIKFEKIEFRIVTLVYFGKLQTKQKTKKIRQGLQKPDFGSGSWLRVRKVSYHICPKTVPLL